MIRVRVRVRVRVRLYAPSYMDPVFPYCPTSCEAHPTISPLIGGSDLRGDRIWDEKGDK